MGKQLSEQNASLACMKPQLPSPKTHQPRVAVLTLKSSIWAVDTGELQVQGQPWLYTLPTWDIGSRKKWGEERRERENNGEREIGQRRTWRKVCGLWYVKTMLPAQNPASSSGQDSEIGKDTAWSEGNTWDCSETRDPQGCQVRKENKNSLCSPVSRTVEKAQRHRASVGT